MTVAKAVAGVWHCHDTGGNISMWKLATTKLLQIRALARIFQGIPSPNFPSIVWGFWRKYLYVDFTTYIMQGFL